MEGSPGQGAGLPPPAGEQTNVKVAVRYEMTFTGRERMPHLPLTLSCLCKRVFTERICSYSPT